MQRLRIDVIDRAYAVILAAKSPAERVDMVAEAHRTVRMLAEAGVRYLHPDWTELQIHSEVARRMRHGAMQM
jgi:hypothetical protein